MTAEIDTQENLGKEWNLKRILNYQLEGPSNMLEVPRATIHRILRCDSNKNPHHIQVFHNLQEEDYPRRAAKCAELAD